MADDEPRDEAGPQGTHLPVGEVEDPGGLVDHDEPDAEQGVGQARDQAQHRLLQGHLEVGEGDVGDGDRQRDTTSSAAGASAPKNTDRTRSPRSGRSPVGPANRTSPFSMK